LFGVWDRWSDDTRPSEYKSATVARSDPRASGLMKPEQDSDSGTGVTVTEVDRQAVKQTRLRALLNKIVRKREQTG